MAVSLVSTGVQFPDSTIQTTAAGASTLVFISSTTVSSSTASVAFTGLSNSTYAYYILEFNNVFGTTNGQALFMNLSSNNGSTYISTYRYMGVYAGAGSGQFFATGGADIAIAGYAQGVGTTTGQSAWGLIEIFNASAVGGNLRWLTGARNDASSNSWQSAIGGVDTSTDTFNAFRLKFSSGNIAGGNFYLYGVKKS